MPFNWLSSIGNNITERARNPFLGTFAFVWLARNWELVFALFNFDKAYTLEGKITFLTERIKYDAFWTELGWNILWTFTILIITYILINLARIISNLFEKRLTPFILKWTDYNSLVPKTEYQGVLNRMNELQERLDKEIQEKIRVQNERDKSEEKLNQLKLEIGGIVEGADQSDEKQESETKLDIEKEKKQDSNKETESDEHFFRTFTNVHSYDKIQDILESVETERKIDYRKEYEIIDELIERGFIVLKSYSEKDEKNTYLYTNEGREFFLHFFSSF